MPSVDLRDANGARTGSVALDEAVFGIQPNVPVLHQVVTAQLAAARSGTQSTKTRAEVSGGGRKPFKQKGTGRARQGSERAPHFTGGGIALGPKPRSYRQRTPRKMVQLALRSALSDRASEGKVLVVESWPWEIPSTKDARAALGSLGVDGKVLVVLSREDGEAYKSFRNLPEVQPILAGELNAYDILCNDWVLFTRETLPGDSPVDQSASPAPTAPPAGAPAPATAAEPADAEVTASAEESPADQTPAAEADTAPASEEDGDE